MRRSLLALVCLPLLYVAVAVIGALVPRNAHWQEPAQGILVFIRTNGVHADLVLPAESGGMDLRRLVPPADVPDPAAARGWVAFGWGQREFYLETPRWADLSARNAARAVFGGHALMHVQHAARPWPSAGARPVRLEPDSYRRLVRSIAAYFSIGDDGRPIPLIGQGYGTDDVFYEARGRYDAFRTSNQWTSDRLADAGVRIGLWTPFAQAVLWRFPERCVCDLPEPLQ